MKNKNIRFGFHIQIGAGLTETPEIAKKLQCKTIQIFTRNPRGWQSKPIDKKDAEIFKNKIREYDINPVIIHMPYLPNPAAPDKEKWERSLNSMIEELQRAEILNVPYVNIHIGKKLDSSPDDAYKKIIKFLDISLEEVKNKVILLLENTAGQGSEIGAKFEEIKIILDNAKYPERLGVCIDTAHLFGAGYDLRTKKSVYETIAEFDKIIGLDRLKAIHYNDSRVELGSHVDRHWHIGEGTIGDEGMKAIITHPKLAHLPFIMETPKKAPNDDKNNLEKILSYLK